MNWFDIFFCDDGGKEYRNSIRAASPCDARKSSGYFLCGAEGNRKNTPDRRWRLRRVFR